MALWLLISGCTNDPFVGIEPGETSNKGFYYIDNGMENTLKVEAMSVGEPSFPLPLLEDEIPSNQVVNIYIFEPTLDVGLTPQDAFGDLKICAKLDSGDSLIYDAVITSDWELREFTEGPNYHLVFPR